MNYCKPLSFFLLLLLLLGNSVIYSQASPAPTGEDTAKKVHILNNTRNLEFRTVDDSTKLTIVTGDVKLRQGTALFYCDSCVINNRTNIFEAWGKVHINDSDTANVYANHLRYLADTKLAYLDGNVKLTDGNATLTTPDLEYDMQTNIGTYKNGGRVVNKKTVLDSKEGYYYADLKDVYFKKDVRLRDPAYSIDTDSLLYNSQTRLTRFIAETTIKDSSGRIIKTREGFYNQATGKAEFGSRPEVTDGDMKITGNRMAIDDSLGTAQIEGNGVVIDNKNHTTIIGGLIFRNKNTDAILATKKPLMIIEQEKDTIYVTADTLFSARLSDRFKTPNNLKPDSSRQEPVLAREVKDSAQISRPDTAAVSNAPGRPITRRSMSEKLKVKNIPATIKKDSVTVPVTDSILAKQKTDTTATKDSVISSSANGKVKDTLAFNEKDSTNRYFEAYRNVRIFSDSLQSVCDSMFYSFKDSVFRLYRDPVVWANNSQVTGDTILLFTKNKKADKVEAFENSFLVNRLENDVYNQIKSARMDGWFADGNIDSVRANAYAECIYYIQDEDSAYTGVNQSQSDIIDIYFQNKELDKVVFRSAVTGTLWPISQKSPAEMKLEGFRWLEARRPKTKSEMFE
jgi:lipopolysaccharide transport protein LptA